MINGSGSVVLVQLIRCCPPVKTIDAYAVVVTKFGVENVIIAYR